MTPTKFTFLITSCLMVFGTIKVNGQENAKGSLYSYYRKGKGAGFVTNDSSFSVNFQFRMQNRALYNSKAEDDLGPQGFEFRVRRLRFKFEGFVVDPRLTYYIQLSTSRGDMDWRGTDNSTINSSANVIRDAVIYYNLSKRIRLGLGQTKLPGNRQRVISSGDQQFYDRSLVNARFNIDRDFGFFAQYAGNFINLRGALTSGEGRNAEMSNSGLAYTGRVEFLPLGKFTDNNDYIEGDLSREETSKISIGTTWSYNERALRQAGQLGNDLFEARNLSSFEVDVLWKYRGWAWYNEYMTRDTDNAITVDPEDATKFRAVYVGEGYLSQLSYLFKNNVEVACRYAVVIPTEQLYDNVSFPSFAEQKTENMELGVTRYINAHRLKIQGGIIHTRSTNLVTDEFSGGSWSAVFQIELGI